MPLTTCVRLAFAIAALITVQVYAADEREKYWPQWRGPYATGVSRQATPPREWSETKNIKWKIEIPGRGSSSPVVWGDRIYLQTAVPVGVASDASHMPLGSVSPRRPHIFKVLAVDRRNGKVVWDKT